MSVEITSSNYFQTDYLSQPPFKDLFVVRTGTQYLINPTIQTYLNKEVQRSKEDEICRHDLAHIQRATHNGLILLSLLQTNPDITSMTYAISPTHVAASLAMHDLGYGSNLRSRKRHVRGHEQESWNIVTSLVQTLPSQNTTRRYIEDPHNLLHTGVLGTAKDYSTLIQNYQTHPNPQNLFALLISAADKADYFIKQRVDHLSPPAYMKNPYHTLAHTVENYNLQVNSDTKTLTYSVNLQKDGQLFAYPSLWQRYAEECFPQVFGLLEAIANIAGYKFVVEIN